MEAGVGPKEGSKENVETSAIATDSGTKTGTFLPTQRRLNSVPAGAQCVECGSRDLAPLPTFSVGSGVGYRPIADDAYCRRCGYMGPPDFKK